MLLLCLLWHIDKFAPEIHLTKDSPLKGYKKKEAVIEDVVKQTISHRCV